MLTEHGAGHERGQPGHVAEGRGVQRVDPGQLGDAPGAGQGSDVVHPPQDRSARCRWRWGRGRSRWPRYGAASCRWRRHAALHPFTPRAATPPPCASFSTWGVPLGEGRREAGAGSAARCGARRSAAAAAPCGTPARSGGSGGRSSGTRGSRSSRRRRRSARRRSPPTAGEREA